MHASDLTHWLVRPTLVHEFISLAKKTFSFAIRYAQRFDTNSKQRMVIAWAAHFKPTLSLSRESRSQASIGLDWIGSVQLWCADRLPPRTCGVSIASSLTIETTKTAKTIAVCFCFTLALTLMAGVTRFGFLVAGQKGPNLCSQPGRQAKFN